MADDSVKIPFSAYDFFGYLASGFLILAATDYAFDGRWLLRDDVGLAFGVLWTVVAYVTGHIVANVSGFILERRIVRGLLHSPEEMLFQAKRPGFWPSLFPGYYERLPVETQERVLSKAMKKARIEQPGRGLFFHCHAIAKRDPATLGRLETFLNLYGFCRNVSMASIVAAVVLVVAVLIDWRHGSSTASAKAWWTVGAIVAAVGMFYRYLKFFRHYTVEVFLTYAETD
jgi:hypothetical protein